MRGMKVLAGFIALIFVDVFAAALPCLAGESKAETWLNNYFPFNNLIEDQMIAGIPGDAYAVAGDMSGKMAVMKLSAQGDVVWCNTYGRGRMVSIRTLDDGGLVVMGSGDDGKALIAKLDSGGNIVKQVKVNDSYKYVGIYSNYIYLVGGFCDNIRVTRLNLTDMTLSAPGDSIEIQSSVVTCIFVKSITFDDSGNLHLVAESDGDGGNQVLIMRFDKELKITKALGINGVADSYGVRGMDIKILPDERILIGGYLSFPTGDGDTPWVASLNKDFTFGYQKYFGTPNWWNWCNSIDFWPPGGGMGYGYVLVCNAKHESPLGRNDLMAIKFHEAERGAPTFDYAKYYSLAESIEVSRGLATADGGAVFCGQSSFQRIRSITCAKVDSAGNIEAKNRLGAVIDNPYVRNSTTIASNPMKDSSCKIRNFKSEDFVISNYDPGLVPSVVVGVGAEIWPWRHAN